jgi:hypothetical protein
VYKPVRSVDWGGYQTPPWELSLNPTLCSSQDVPILYLIQSLSRTDTSPWPHLKGRHCIALPRHSQADGLQRLSAEESEALAERLPHGLHLEMPHDFGAVRAGEEQRSANRGSTLRWEDTSMH